MKAGIADFANSCLQDGSIFRGTFDYDSPEFDWGSNYKQPNLPPEDLIIYEMGIRSFTADISSGLPAGQLGTYTGLKQKANALELKIKTSIIAMQKCCLFWKKTYGICWHCWSGCLKTDALNGRSPPSWAPQDITEC